MGDVMFNKFLIIMTFSALSLFGCGGGGTTTPSSATSVGTPDTPTDTSLVFSIFAPEYLGGSYLVAFPLTGSDTNGDTYTATQSVKSGTPADAFIGAGFVPVKVIDVDTIITNTNTNAVIEIADNKYYTHEAFTDIRYFGYTNSLGFLATPTSELSINIIPLTATIGNFGTVGHYTRTDGSGFTQSWELTDGFNGKAILIVTTLPDDITTDTYPTTVEKFLISQDGAVSGYEVIITYHASNNTITLTN